MKPLPHNYEVALNGASAGYATLSGTGLPDLTTAPPAEYDGPGDAWSPEHLLLAAVGSCFVFTFRAVANALHVDFAEVEVHTAGTVDKDAAGATRFTDIVVRTTVTAANGATAAALQRAIDKAATRCLVSSSLVTPVRVEATIRGAAAPAVAA